MSLNVNRISSGPQSLGSQEKEEVSFNPNANDCFTKKNFNELVDFHTKAGQLFFTIHTPKNFIGKKDTEFPAHKFFLTHKLQFPTECGPAQETIEGLNLYLRCNKSQDKLHHIIGSHVRPTFLKFIQSIVGANETIGIRSEHLMLQEKYYLNTAAYLNQLSDQLSKSLIVEPFDDLVDLWYIKALKSPGSISTKRTMFNEFCTYHLRLANEATNPDEIARHKQIAQAVIQIFKAITDACKIEQLRAGKIVDQLSDHHIEIMGNGFDLIVPNADDKFLSQCCRLKEIIDLVADLNVRCGVCATCKKYEEDKKA